MRHFFIALMIALLPLRGWVGDAMAMSMWSPAQHAPAVSCHDTVAMPVTAAMTAPHGSADHHPVATADSHGQQHSSCDVCNGPALADAGMAHPAQPLEQPGQTLLVERFASSEPQRGHKPPIS